MYLKKRCIWNQNPSFSTSKTKSSQPLSNLSTLKYRSKSNVNSILIDYSAIVFHKNKPIAMYKRYFSILTLVAGLFAACSSGIDTTPPRMSLKLPSGNMNLQTGDSLFYLASFTDNKHLGDFIIEVQPNFEFQFFEQDVWDTLLNKNLSGQSSVADIKLGVVPPHATAGLYHFTTYCTDLSSNRSEEMQFELYIENINDQTPPVVEFIAPLPTAEPITVLTPNVVYIVKAVDDVELGKGILKIFHLAKDSTVYQVPISDFLDAQEKTIAITFPAPKESGIYRSRFIVADAVNNQTTTEFELEIR